MENTMGKMVYVRSKKTKAGEPGWWPENKKIEAVTTYLSVGSMPLAAAMVKVPLHTMNHWKKQPWWKEMEFKIKDEDNQELDSKFTKIIRKTLDVVEDRIENGNYQFDPKTGRVIRIPVNLRDTHRVMADLVDKRRVIRNQPTVEAENKNQMNDRLLTLAEQFAKFALGKQEDSMKVVSGTEIYENDSSMIENNTSQTGIQPHREDNDTGLIPTPT